MGQTKVKIEYRTEQVLTNIGTVSTRGGQRSSRSRADYGKLLMYQNKIIPDQIRKSAISQVLYGRFEYRKKQQARTNVRNLCETTIIGV